MENDGIEIQALAFARKSHGNQKRKYKDELFIEHLIRVAERVKNVPHTPEMVAAAYLHDVVEDTTVTPTQVARTFGKKVGSLVKELTDEYTKGKYPHLNRRWRKKKEVERIAQISWDAKTIKLADIIDNLPSISQNDPKFARIYIPEMEALIEVLAEGNPELLARAQEELRLAKEKAN